MNSSAARILVLAMAVVSLIAAGTSGAAGQGVSTDDALDALVAAYPDHLASRDGNMLVWHDGTRMVIDDGVAKSHEQKLANGDIEDMMSQAYPVGPCSYGPPARNFDPGRIRNEAFIRKMYGATRREAQAKLTGIRWFGATLQVTRVNGIDRKLISVARDLDGLAGKFLQFFNKSGGTFNWRVIAGTDRLSVHSFGAAIDINTKYADYWRWQGGKPGNVRSYRNKIPMEVVKMFERHGFIWGGKWYHYDTMHFEYRPELVATATRCKSP